MGKEGLRQRKKAKPSDAQQSSSENPTIIKEQEKEPASTPNRNEYAIDLRHAVLVFVALSVRLFFVNYPDQVTWDELHFAKFAGHYLTGKYYFDVHPPLGKLVYGAVAYLGGQVGPFDLHRIGSPYAGTTIPYVFMRCVSVVCGTTIVSLAYQLIRACGYSRNTALVAGLVTTFDPMAIVLSRFILLDAMLVAANLAACLGVVKAIKSPPLSRDWLQWVAFTGLALSAAVSIKFTSIFTVALVGLLVVDYLNKCWDATTMLTIRQVAAIFAVKVVLLIMLPVAVYLACFWVHFTLLPKSGSGDAFMSMDFQRGLINSPFAREQAAASEIANLSLITLRPAHLSGGWLHSHPHRYPIYPSGDKKGLVSSYQQQVTLYSFESDDNNWWQVQVVRQGAFAASPMRIKGHDVLHLRHDDVIRLVHAGTGLPLNSHDVAAPLSHDAQEVTCYAPGDERVPAGQPGHMPKHDLWRVEVLGSTDPRVTALTTSVRFVHLQTETALVATGKQLPAWAFNQMEVATHKLINTVSRLINTTAAVWIIDNHRHDLLPDFKPIQGLHNTTMSFWAKLVDLHRAMFKANSKLVHQHNLSSKPWEWPLARQGIPFWHGANKQQVYLLGNPFLWTISLVALGYVSSAWLVERLALRRQLLSIDAIQHRRFTTAVAVCVGGWAINYLPFFLFERQLFLHHYFLSAVFSMLVLPLAIDHSGRTRMLYLPAVLTVLVAVLAIGWFIAFAPLIYGLEASTEHLEAIKLNTNWTIKTSWNSL
eukprot:TRINITY_DN9883_c0_g1_i4.p1 TRINITY_DN9883_c0_g1~~TRINITY_DN9883_c0_g1_i4.p1  ORF type:complete len:762 (+),score=107.35 TRINITY_DN9883_c0_g1_i4:27-2312(+)